jgi:predicted alpha-1,2-mannosidase
LAVVDRSGLGEIIQGFLEAYRQSGWFPRWPSPGLRQCMIGSHGDSIVADAILSDVGGFNHDEAYEAIRKDAFVHSDDPRLGRAALNEYLRLGYVPVEAAAESVCWTLDNAHCDWCIAQVAKKLGRSNDADVLLQRAQNYRHLWHRESRLMRPRRADGSWNEPWREFEWGGAYVEGGPWQHSLHVPHDPQGLATLHGGIDALLARVDEMFSLPPRYERGTYWEEIHEMTEVALATDDEGRSFGQYAHSNQPVHNYLFLAAALGQGRRSTPHVKRVMQAMYSPNAFAGDEDNGEMSAWYILAAAGRVPACPGSGKLVPLDIGTFGPAQLIDVGPQ